MNRTLLAAVLVCLLTGACNGDSGNDPVPDTAVAKDQATQEAAVDLGRDTSADAAGDVGAVDAAASEGGAKEGGAKEAGLEASAPDLVVDSAPPKPDAPGNVILQGTVTRSVTPVNDGKGDLHVAISQVIWPFPPIVVVSTSIPSANLVKVGAKVNYTISSFTAVKGAYEVSAWMDDNNNAWSPLPLAQGGDLVLSKAVKLTFAGKPLKQDLVLDKVQVMTAGDAGLGTGLRGKITASTSPSLDGKGNILISLHSQKPPAGLVGTPEYLGSADLSSPFTSEAYFLAGIKPGKYYLRVFMDDNGNSNLLAPVSDKGDMVHSKPVQVHVVGGQVASHDVTLDALKK